MDTGWHNSMEILFDGYTTRYPKICETLYWSKLPFPSPGDLPDSGIEPKSPALQADSIQTQPPGKSFLSVENVYLKKKK